RKFDVLSATATAFSAVAMPSDHLPSFWYHCAQYKRQSIRCSAAERSSDLSKNSATRSNHSGSAFLETLSLLRAVSATSRKAVADASGSPLAIAPRKSRRPSAFALSELIKSPPYGSLRPNF